MKSENRHLALILTGFLSIHVLLALFGIVDELRRYANGPTHSMWLAVYLVSAFMCLLGLDRRLYKPEVPEKLQKTLKVLLASDVILWVVSGWVVLVTR